MKYALTVFLLINSFYIFPQTIEVVEQSVSVCYMNDGKRTNVIAVTKANAELEDLEIIGYFDCNSPVSGPCGEASLGKYKPNSISINGETLGLGGQLNGNNITAFNVGRFFSAKDDLHRFLIFEMADVDCPNLPERYCYIILCLDQKNKIIKYVVYNKDNNPIMEDELSSIIEGTIKNVLKINYLKIEEQEYTQ